MRPLPTTHPVADKDHEKTTITRERHPFEGQSLEIVERRRHNGQPHLLLKLPDGSRLRVPAGWTTVAGAKAGDVLAPTGSPRAIAPVELLVRARILVDSLLRRTATPSSAVGSQHEEACSDQQLRSGLVSSNGASPAALDVSWRGPQVVGMLGRMLRGSRPSEIGERLSWRHRVHWGCGLRYRSTSRRVFDRGTRSGGDACCARPHRTRPASRVC